GGWSRVASPRETGAWRSSATGPTARSSGRSSGSTPRTRCGRFSTTSGRRPNGRLRLSPQRERVELAGAIDVAGGSLRDSAPQGQRRLADGDPPHRPVRRRGPHRGGEDGRLGG